MLGLMFRVKVKARISVRVRVRVGLPSFVARLHRYVIVRINGYIVAFTSRFEDFQIRGQTLFHILFFFE